MTRHVVIGGTGFIGRHVACLLARQGHAVTIASRRPPAFSFPPDVAASIRWQPLEAGDEALDRLVADAGCVHHYAWCSIPATAAADPAGDRAINLGVTAAVVRALARRGGGRLVFSSSGGTVYGSGSATPTGETEKLEPSTPYGATKAAAEALLLQAGSGIDCRIARVANPYGAGQDSARQLGAVSVFLDAALAGRPVTIWGDGTPVRDYIHVGDVAHALVKLAAAPPGSETVFNIATGVGTSLNQLVAVLRRILGRPVPVRRLPARSFDRPVSVLSPERAGRTLGWAPRLCLDEGIRLTIEDLMRRSPIATMPYLGTGPSGEPIKRAHPPAGSAGRAPERPSHGIPHWRSPPPCLPSAARPGP